MGTIAFLNRSGNNSRQNLETTPNERNRTILELFLTRKEHNIYTSKPQNDVSEELVMTAKHKQR